MRILIVEDEPRIAGTIADLLSTRDYASDWASDGQQGLALAGTGQYDMVILDVMLPKLDGFQVVHSLRRQGNRIPVLMLTARTEVEDRVAGLDCGADYYLTKPFSGQELLACIRALTRRSGEGGSSELVFGDLRLEPATGQLTCGERSLRLSRKELELMTILMKNPERPAGKESLMEQIWGGKGESEEKSVEVYISFLRKKLAYLESRGTIRTIRTVGYRLEMGSQT